MKYNIEKFVLNYFLRILKPHKLKKCSSQSNITDISDDSTWDAAEIEQDHMEKTKVFILFPR